MFDEEDNVLNFDEYLAKVTLEKQKGITSAEVEDMQQVHQKIVMKISNDWLQIAMAAREKCFSDGRYELTNEEMFSVAMMLGVKSSARPGIEIINDKSVSMIETEPCHVSWNERLKQFEVQVNREDNP